MKSSSTYLRNSIKFTSYNQKNFKSRFIIQNHCMHHKNFQKQQEKSSLKRFFATNWLLQHAHVEFILWKQTCRSNCVGLGQRERQVPLNFIYWTQKLLNFAQWHSLFQNENHFRQFLQLHTEKILIYSNNFDPDFSKCVINFKFYLIFNIYRNHYRKFVSFASNNIYSYNYNINAEIVFKKVFCLGKKTEKKWNWSLKVFRNMVI